MKTKSKKIKVACIEFSAQADSEKNLKRAEKWIRTACRRGADLVCLPEAFEFRGDAKQLKLVADTIPGKVTGRFCALAKTEKVDILLGSIFEKTKKPGKYYNTSVLIGSSGHIKAVYRKRHLFEIRQPDGLCVKEGRDILPGQKDVLATVKGIRLGLGVCYDLRFPEFLGRLIKKGAEIMLLPSNFVYETGKVHWEVLCRARAIENLCFVVAPNQNGKNPCTGLRAFGHSLIVDPWGKVLARGTGSGERIVMATLDLRFLRRIRHEFPALPKRFSSS